MGSEEQESRWGRGRNAVAMMRLLGMKHTAVAVTVSTDPHCALGVSAEAPQAGPCQRRAESGQLRGSFTRQTVHGPGCVLCHRDSRHSLCQHPRSAVSQRAKRPYRETLRYSFTFKSHSGSPVSISSGLADPPCQPNKYMTLSCVDCWDANESAHSTRQRSLDGVTMFWHPGTSGFTPYAIRHGRG